MKPRSVPLGMLVALAGPLLAACGGGGTGGGPTGGGPPTWSVGGMVSGLAGSGLVLLDNGGDPLSISANGSFAFATRLAGGSPYLVTVATQPTRPTQTCSVASGGGTVGSADVTSVAVTCAPQYDFSCAGAPSPAVAPTTITISGTLSTLSSTPQPVSGETVSAKLVAGDALLASATTALDGTFTLAVPNPSGTPLDAYLLVDKVWPTSYYPARPFAADVANLGLIDVDGGSLTLAYAAANYGYLQGRGTALVAVADCAGTPLQGATVAFSPAAGRVEYSSGTWADPAATSTGPEGSAWGLAVPAGAVTASATSGGALVRSRAFKVGADTFQQVVIRP